MAQSAGRAVMGAAAIGRGMLWLAAVGSGANRLSILIYHRVVDRRDPHRPDDLDAATFAGQAALLRSCCHVLPLGDAVRMLRAGRLPPRAAAITFDDGYLDNYTVARPILETYQLPATFFIATAFLEGGCMWNDQVIEAVRAPRATRLDVSDLGLGSFDLESAGQRQAAALRLIELLKYRSPPERSALVGDIQERLGGAAPSLMMREEHVAALARGGMEIGAHTVTHPILARLDDAAARHEIAASRATLERIVRAPVSHFAYPNG